MEKNKTLVFLFFVSLKDLKQCLQDAGETVIQLSLDTVDAETQSAVMATGDAQPGASHSYAHMEVDSVKAEAEVPTEAAVVPEDTKDGEEATADNEPAESCTSAAEVTLAVKDGEEATADDEPAEISTSTSEATPAVSSGSTYHDPSAAEPQPEENSGQLEINEEIFKALKAAVDERRIILASRAQHENNMVHTHLGR